jgi:predicted TIM-barrel enzyme
MTQYVATLRTARDSGRALVGVSAGIGIVAKWAERAGADMLFVLASGRSRHLGVPTTTHLGNATEVTLAMLPEIVNVVATCPIVAGLEGADSTRRNLADTVTQLMAAGASGITNFPSATEFMGEIDTRSHVGEGVEREFEIIREAKRQGALAVAQVFRPDHVRDFLDAGSDVIVARCGPTFGGLMGPEPLSSLDEDIALLTEIVAVAEEVKPGTIVLGQGGNLVAPEDVQRAILESGIAGVVAESAVERIAIERYVRAEVEALKSQTLR